MKIVVIGATGMLGQALCQKGEQYGWHIDGVARQGAQHCLDIIDDASLIAFLEVLQPDVVINAAAVSNLASCEYDPCGAYMVNARAVAVLAHTCNRLGCYLVQISTDHYFSGDREQLHTETSSVTLVNEYARTKYAGECFALSCSGALVVRTNIVGFRGSAEPTFAEWAIKSLESGSRFTLFDDFFTSSIHVAGFSSALYDLLPLRPSGTLNLASHEVSNKKTFIEQLAASLDLDTRNTLIGSVTELTGAKRAESLGLDVSRAEALLGYQLPTVTEVTVALSQEYRRRNHAIQ